MEGSLATLEPALAVNDGRSYVSGLLVLSMAWAGNHYPMINYSFSKDIFHPSKGGRWEREKVTTPKIFNVGCNICEPDYRPKK